MKRISYNEINALLNKGVPVKAYINDFGEMVAEINNVLYKVINY